MKAHEYAERAISELHAVLVLAGGNHRGELVPQKVKEFIYSAARNGVLIRVDFKAFGKYLMEHGDCAHLDGSRVLEELLREEGRE